MKRKFLSIVTFILVAIMSVFSFAGCKETGDFNAKIVEMTETVVVIEVTSIEKGNPTLLKVMENLQEQGKLNFTLKGTMVQSINGAENKSDWSAWWALYTSDSEMANNEWGTYDYGGQTLGSAIVGADALEVMAGQIYVWVYTTNG